MQMKTPVAAFGTDMTLKGQAMKVKLPRKVNASLVAGQGAGAGMDYSAALNSTQTFCRKLRF
jgi:hypothetical protein